ncbi:aspartyl-phosphate phosphatase Spo0E family protein [Indiicoccus explosivorum]|uniref:aspartyl-phosphate phosphatase Spo0E family protein n=1 Tax=Indiicoccus explosivorum TaxID=1917864 RepID=UPI00118640C4|nr:aspartyl-phosphate phosphatase Spo0E family protein [Indiicoccus explosivorum]
MRQSVSVIELEATRRAMIESAVRHGVASPEALRLSRRLDAMLNIYEKSRSGPLYGKSGIRETDRPG